MKKSWIFSLIAFIVPLVSAYYGAEPSFNTSMIDANTVFIAFSFLFIFAGVMWVFRKNKSMGVVKTMLAFGISLFSIWRIWISGFDFEQFVNNIGFSSIMWPVLILGIVAILIYIMVKGKLQAIFFILSGLLFSAAIFFSVINKWQLYTIAGIIFLILGIISKKDNRTKKTLGRIALFLSIVSFILAALNVANLAWVFIVLGIIFILIGIFLLKKRMKSFPNTTNLPPTNSNQTPTKSDLRKQGLEILKNLAKYFRKWAKGTNNPNFNGSWANFINFIGKQNQYGKTEKEICKRLHISKSDFVKIFNRYGKP